MVFKIEIRNWALILLQPDSWDIIIFWSDWIQKGLIVGNVISDTRFPEILTKGLLTDFVVNLGMYLWLKQVTLGADREKFGKRFYHRTSFPEIMGQNRIGGQRPYKFY